MSSFTKLKGIGKILYSLPYSIYFNLKHLPFKQALKLPIILYHAKVIGKGKYIIEGPIKTGMIRLGFPIISIYKGKGIVLENKGTIIFQGKAGIGANAGLSIGKYGKLTLGDDFKNSYGMKLVCYHEITIGHTARFGWESFLCDTDFHSLKSEDGTKHAKGFGKIKFGDEVWVGSFSKFYKNTEIPSRCTVAANTLVNKKIECEPYSLIYSGAGIKVKHTGYYRDINDDVIDYTAP